MQKKVRFALLLTLVLAAILAACASGGSDGAASDVTVLVVTDGTTQKSYTSADLEALGTDQATFQDVTYLGVPLTTLLADAGYDAQSLRAVKVTAVDGYTVNYDPEFFLLPDTLVSYARLDGPLSDDELPFRMVLPNAEGKMNARMIVEITAVP